MAQKNYNDPLRITIREREKWFKYYNVLKNNHLINYLIIRGLTKTSMQKWGVNTLQLFILIIIYLFRGKEGSTTFGNIWHILTLTAPEYTKISLSSTIKALTTLKHIHKTKMGHYSLTSSGKSIVVSFQRHFFKTYEELNLILSHTN